MPDGRQPASQQGCLPPTGLLGWRSVAVYSKPEKASVITDVCYRRYLSPELNLQHVNGSNQT